MYPELTFDYSIKQLKERRKRIALQISLSKEKLERTHEEDIFTQEIEQEIINHFTKRLRLFNLLINDELKCLTFKNKI